MYRFFMPTVNQSDVCIGPWRICSTVVVVVVVVNTPGALYVDLWLTTQAQWRPLLLVLVASFAACIVVVCRRPRQPTTSTHAKKNADERTNERMSVKSAKRAFSA